jgi:kynurenine formamidase
LIYSIFSVEGARLLLRLGAALVGIDAMYIDPTYQDATGLDLPANDLPDEDVCGYPVHDILLSHDILTVENLCNLHKIKQIRGAYSFLPLK